LGQRAEPEHAHFQAALGRDLAVRKRGGLQIRDACFQGGIRRDHHMGVFKRGGGRADGGGAQYNQIAQSQLPVPQYRRLASLVTTVGRCRPAGKPGAPRVKRSAGRQSGLETTAASAPWRSFSPLGGCMVGRRRTAASACLWGIAPFVRYAERGRAMFKASNRSMASLSEMPGGQPYASATASSSVACNVSSHLPSAVPRVM
jgi:hypothetical protein